MTASLDERYSTFLRMTASFDDRVSKNLKAQDSLKKCEGRKPAPEIDELLDWSPHVAYSSRRKSGP
jgi:hypothetical protein